MIEKVLTRVRSITSGIRQMPLSLAHKAQLRAALLWSKVAQAPKGAVYAVARSRSGILRTLVGMLGLSLMLTGAVGIAAVRYGLPLFERVALGQLDIQPIVVLIADTAWIGLSVSIGLVVTGLVLALGASSGFKSLLRSPITTYRKLIRGRDWLLAFVGRLQAESAKWKTAFNVMKLPYSILLKAGFSPQMAIGLLAVGGTAGGGVLVNETLLAEKSFARGDPGVYTAPLDIPVFYEESFNTLRLDLGATSVGLVEITDVSLNSYTGSALPSGETNVIHVGGMPTVADPAFTETFLEVGTLEADRWRCETLTISNSQVNKLIIKSMVSDGQSIAAVAGTPRDRGINGGNRADDMKTQSGYYDMLKLTAASTGQNGFIDYLRISNVYSRGGGCLIDRVKAGTMIISYGVIGGDSSLATKAFTVATSVIFKSFENEGNVEVAMAVPAIVDMTQ